MHPNPQVFNKLVLGVGQLGWVRRGGTERETLGLPIFLHTDTEKTFYTEESTHRLSPGASLPPLGGGSLPEPSWGWGYSPEASSVSLD